MTFTVGKGGTQCVRGSREREGARCVRLGPGVCEAQGRGRPGVCEAEWRGRDQVCVRLMGEGGTRCL